MEYRLNRAIAATGFCSRRKADDLIADGLVRVNGKVVTDFNFLVDLERDKLEADGERLRIKNYEYIALYKPPGVITTCNDQFERPDVLSLIPEKFHYLKPVGRLDMESEGLILLTNDGDMTYKLTHPKSHIFKRYIVDVEGNPPDTFLKKMADGVKLDDGMTLPAKTKLIGKSRSRTTFQLEITEGRNRQIRRMCSRLGYPVIRLVRVAIGGLQLRQMEPGDWRHLTDIEVRNLVRVN